MRVQGGSQPQVGVQVPLTQTAPAGQVTPEQGLATQRPLTQNSPAAHVTVSHAVRGVQVMWHVNPSAQRPGHATVRVQRPVPSSQNCPAGQWMPAHGAGKHPDTQRPPKHVSFSLQRTPAQTSRTGTQRI